MNVNWAAIDADQLADKVTQKFRRTVGRQLTGQEALMTAVAGAVATNAVREMRPKLTEVTFYRQWDACHTLLVFDDHPTVTVRPDCGTT
ncbi:hypothetical protein [Paraburkholderia adhaesiva]|uniref:hypothetical protein n=1 Tax=Paraburkholderia adhaesiva TaxID=2883244 RepID=UPI001F44E8F7|nr:hypothetical protein [Paraburkholderia adhaesiva]